MLQPRLRRVDDALAAYAAALPFAARAEAHSNVAALPSRRHLACAEGSLRDAARLRPDWPQAFLGLGHLYFRQGRFEDAERAFERAATLAPESVEALFNQAQALDRLRGWAEALPLLRRARELAPENEEIWAALRSHLLLFQRHEKRSRTFARSSRTRRSARIVAAGLLRAHRAGTEYEDKVRSARTRLALPLGRTWPGRRGARAVAILRRAACRAQASLRHLHPAAPGRARRRVAVLSRGGPSGLRAPAHRLPVCRLPRSRQ